MFFEHSSRDEKAQVEQMSDNLVFWRKYSMRIST